MSTQKALILEQAKAPFVLDTVPIPSPGLGEVLVKVKASALNPVDCAIQAWGIIVTSYPTILGRDIAGDVEQLGKDVQGLSKGDRVFFKSQFFRTEYGGFQQYALVSASSLGKVPSHISYDQAASIPLTFTTAAVGLLPEKPHGAGLSPTLDPSVKFPNESALVIGGGTSVGQFAIQILNFLGFKTIITYASAKHTDYLKSLGATHLVDRSRFRSITSAPIKTVYVAVLMPMPGTQDAGYACLAPGGQMIVAIPEPVKREEDPEGRRVIGINASAPYYAGFMDIMWKKLPKMVEDGAVVPNRVEVLPNGLVSIVDGLKRLQNGEVSGVKLVVHPQETPIGELTANLECLMNTVRQHTV
ncbi:GroES-like protein [Gymnopus androsaceus JB14]|uniref:GroES-like protein n=1 Tax=Gymnopus androsaceus JB14 TaxID=1447944 RepID=A0A6A4HGF2_9AGAR|nr:GroES-like protein [Gymnopus androsaceus JB14]